MNGVIEMTLKELRTRAGLSQKAVGIALSVNQSAVSLWESGKHRPCRKYHKALAELYRCKVSELFEED